METPTEKIYLFANWKMYLDYDGSNQLAQALADKLGGKLGNINMAVFPNALSLHSVRETVESVGIDVGTQNVYWHDSGGYTGEISAEMYAEAGCKYSLIGHSERRHIFGETNDQVRQKIEAALTAGLTPVLCVGETLAEKEAGQVEAVIESQLRAAYSDLDWPADRELIVAYEPVWAVGTGVHCEPDEAEKVQKMISQLLAELVSGVNPVLLYGGSVRPENVKAFVAKTDIDGVLVGGASAKLDSWLDITKAVSA